MHALKTGLMQANLLLLDVSEKYLSLIRFRRATKRDIFSRAVWKFDVVLNSEQ